MKKLPRDTGLLFVSYSDALRLALLVLERAAGECFLFAGPLTLRWRRGTRPTRQFLFCRWHPPQGRCFLLTPGGTPT
jgi:hypothetical protein